MASFGPTPVPEAAVAPSSPLGADGSEATPGVGLEVGPTSAPTTTAPGGFDLDSLDGLEPTPFGACASTGTLPAEALAPGGGYGSEVVDLLGLDPDDSPDASNLWAALVEADATPDQDTATGDGPPTLSTSASSASLAPGAGQPTTDPGPSAPEARAFWEGLDPAPTRTPPPLVADPPFSEAGWDALTSYLAEFDAAEGRLRPHRLCPSGRRQSPRRCFAAGAYVELAGKAATGAIPAEAASSSTARAVLKAPPVLEPEAPSASTTPPPSMASTLGPTPPAAVPKKAAPPELQDQEQVDPHRQEFLRRQAFIRQEQAARSYAGLRQLPDNVDYDTALASQIEREFAEQRAMGPPPAQRPAAASGQATQADRASGPPPEQAHPAPRRVQVVEDTHPRPVPGRPTPATTIESPWQDYLNADAAAQGAAASSSAVPPPPKASFPSVEMAGQGRHGFGSRNRVPAPRAGRLYGVSTLALVAAGPDRPDLPARRAEARASLAAAVEAVRPANLKRAIAELRGDMLAKTTRGPYESRLKTWNRLAYEGEVAPWPISAHVLEVIGAGFKKGAYRSAKEYFLAAFRHQENELRIAVDPFLRRLANRIIRSVVRGLPGSRLKEAFPVLAL
ncbi:unnamed protein product, partial [Symbiodinium sp. CCMP2456]